MERIVVPVAGVVEEERDALALPRELRRPSPRLLERAQDLFRCTRGYENGAISLHLAELDQKVAESSCILLGVVQRFVVDVSDVGADDDRDSLLRLRAAREAEPHDGED